MDEPLPEFQLSPRPLDSRQSSPFTGLLPPVEASLPEPKACGDYLDFVRPPGLFLDYNGQPDFSEFLDLPSDALCLSDTTVDPLCLQGHSHPEADASASQFGQNTPDQIGICSS